MTYDDFGVVTNSKSTCLDIAAVVLSGRPALVSWTDGDGTQLDLLMCYRPMRFGLIASGLSVSAPLMIGVLREGCFGFDVNGSSSPDYIAEKLGLSEWRESSTLVKLTEFVNMLRQTIANGANQ